MPDRLPRDILLLVFDCFEGDSQTLARVGFICRSWRNLSLPVLLRDVNLSSHNDGRLPEHENTSPLFPLLLRVVTADFGDEYRPRNLVSRQRAFLRLMVDRPELATYVRAFTWTLIWLDFDERALTPIDLQLWKVFGRMKNVARLDLASLHENGMSDLPYIRQNPTTLFPAVTDLRLVGWMHRRLVKAILTSIEATRLCCLTLDYLHDEGTLPGPDGQPLPEDWATKYQSRSFNASSVVGIDDELWARQERGEAAIFPGPMWFPLRFLRQYRLNSLSKLYIKLGPFGLAIDQRNYEAMFHQTAEFVRSTKDTLKVISIGLGEDPYLHCKEEDMRHNGCGTRSPYRPICFELTISFTYRLLAALTKERYAHLERVDLKGFRILLCERPGLARPPDPRVTLRRIRDCPFVDESFTDIANVDYRRPFTGYDFDPPVMDENKLNELADILYNS